MPTEKYNLELSDENLTSSIENESANLMEDA
jgi:hypothetical protein